MTNWIMEVEMRKGPIFIRSQYKGMTNTPESGSSQIVIYQTEDGKTRLEVRLEQETVWLTQKMMAELFQVSVPTINEHIKNVYKEAELLPEATIRKFRIVQKEGQRTIGRMLDFYNLDMIISVGYRVKSHIATRFRQWATQRLREYIVKGFVLDDERLKKPDRPFDYFDELLRRIPMHMKEWIKKLDGFLTLNDRNILDHAGKVSHQMAKELAEAEYDKFHRQRLGAEARKADEDDFQKLAQRLEEERKDITK